MSGFQPDAFQPDAFQTGAISSGAAATHTFREPIITRIFAKRAAESGFIGQSLLLTTLAAAAAIAPFVPAQLDNPVTRKATPIVQPASNLLLTTLAPVGLPEGRQQDFPNPVTNKYVLRTTIARGGFVDAAVVEIPIGSQHDWQNPVPRKASPRTDESTFGRLPSSIIPPMPDGLAEHSANPVARRPAGQTDLPENLLLSTLVPAAAPPFVQSAFANPATRRPAGQADTPENLLTSTLAPAAAQDFPPGRPLDWQNPARAKSLLRVNIHRSSYDPPIEATPLPVGRQLDWTNPFYRKSLTGLEVEHARYYEVSDPFKPALWPNPQVRSAAQQPQLWQNLLLGTLSTPPPALPVGRQTEWPNPAQPKWQVRGDARGNLLLTTLFVAPALPPGRQLDWTNPPKPKWRDVRYSFTGTPLPNAIPPVTGFPSFSGPIPDQSVYQWTNTDRVKAGAFFSDVRTFRLAGNVPPGMGINVDTGDIYGIPSELGVYAGITVIATNNFGSTASNAFTITITLQPNPDTSGQLLGPRRIRALGLKAFARKRS